MWWVYFQNSLLKRQKKIILLKIKHGVVEMAQWVKALPFSHEDPSLNSYNLCAIQTHGERILNLSASLGMWEVETGETLNSGLAQTSKTQQTKRPSLRQGGRSVLTLGLSSSLHIWLTRTCLNSHTSIHTSLHGHTHTNTHTYAHTSQDVDLIDLRIIKRRKKW